MQFKNTNKTNGFKHISHGMEVKKLFSPADPARMAMMAMSRGDY
jgi:hypothetical protein